MHNNLRVGGFFKIETFAAGPLGGFVKRLIRNSATRAYLAEDGQWTFDANLAWQFKDIKELLTTARSLHLAGAEEVIQVGDKPSDQWDVVLPLARF